MTQVIKCKCGAIRAACAEPDCYTDKDWQRDVRAYVKKGYTVETVQSGVQFSPCTCGKIGLNKPQQILLDLLKTKPSHYRQEVFERVGFFGQTVIAEDGTRHFLDVGQGVVSIISIGSTGSLVREDKTLHIFTASELKQVQDALEGKPQQMSLF